MLQTTLQESGLPKCSTLKGLANVRSPPMRRLSVQWSSETSTHALDKCRCWICEICSPCLDEPGFRSTRNCQPSFTSFKISQSNTTCTPLTNCSTACFMNLALSPFSHVHNTLRLFFLKNTGTLHCLIWRRKESCALFFSLLRQKIVVRFSLVISSRNQPDLSILPNEINTCVNI